ncbi:hypothetical protein DRN43_06265 [Thermococci archaeon]|uniref:hypothetical protein n=1 Tax=Palaeococcus sp. (in: euryarchaeotes) TaxID=2820298 RepID=UPI000F2CB258|nr:hypothetical protein [Palaeococcus sp. (in: euryarchaeotes)]MCD6558600.1 hypothetical protein [Palaeococcus sp. (in: euryarchaeotes)]RLF88258.1 MAG: hypothetical protein DRN43_06265 [Thermococci archaeon]
MKTLVVSVDRSKEKRTIYALVEIDYNNLDELRKHGGWLKHIAELRKQEKRNYIAKFPKRFDNIKPLLKRVIVTPFFNEIRDEIMSHDKEIRVLIVDDAILKKLKEYQSQKNVFKESIAKNRGEFRHVVLLTDNIAYIGRKIYEKNPNPNTLRKELHRKGIL